MNDEGKGSGITRQAFLRTGLKAGALGAATASLGLGLSSGAQAHRVESWAATAKVDVHNHLLPASYAAALAGIGINGAGGIPFPTWDADSAVAALDQFGINVAILSLSSPGVYLPTPLNANPAAFAIAQAAKVNDVAVAAVAKYPKRFGFFATLPMPLVEESIAEAQRAFSLGADGVVMLTSIANKYVGHSDYAPLMSYLDSIGARVFIHPNASSLLTTLGVGVQPPAPAPFQPTPPLFVEFPFETTRAVVNLLVNNIPNKYPKIRFILAHAGGTVPYLAGRIGYLLQNPAIAAMYPGGLTTVLQKFYYDTALSTFEYPQAALRALVPPSHILFGSDYPFASPTVVTTENAQLESHDVLAPWQRDDVGYKNAKALFPSLKYKL